MTLDAKAEASKRWPMGTGQSSYDAFLAGAVWALREFGDLLNDADPSIVGTDVALTLGGWGCDAHHIADGIEGQ